MVYLVNSVHNFVFVQGSRVVGNLREVTKGRTLLVITQVISGLKKLYTLIFSKYLHVKQWRRKILQVRGAE